MKKGILTLFCLVLFACAGMAQDLSYKDQMIKDREEKNLRFEDTTRSPLRFEEILVFTGLNYFEPNEKYKVTATFVKAKKSKVFKMKTSTDRMPEYKKYGELTFKIDTGTYTLSVYQNMRLVEEEEYKHHLFLPFTDNTSGSECYGGGRYVDLKKPAKGKLKTIEIDFNEAYNPYCAYTDRFSCPIPPAENSLNIRIEAGETAYHEGDHH
jgi:uncharacterized protein (DUF1684 family)